MFACNVSLHLELILKEFNAYICHLYEKIKHSLHNDSWSPVAHKGCVHRLLIHQLKKNVNKEQIYEGTSVGENVAILKYHYITSNIEDIFKNTESGVSKGKTVLIEGISGIGKTILCKEMAYRWSRKELLQSDRLVLLVFLRDPAVQNIKSVEDLVQYMYGSICDDKVIKLSKACATYLINTEGINITIILDGFNELLQLKCKNDFIFDLLHKKILPKCRVVVSSCPLASKQLQQIIDVKVEILGITEENRQIYINNEFKDDYERSVRIKLYLKENNNINKLCYNLFMISVLVHVAKEYKELPNSVTKLYSKFIACIISKYLQKFQSDFAVSDLNALPLKVKRHFLRICKYAYNTLQYGKTVFTANEIIQQFVTFSDAQGRWSAFGLLSSSQYYNNEDNSYSFLHLSIQEYLAAFYVTTLSTREQINIIKRFFFVDKFLNMWIMYCGLSERPIALIHFLTGKRSLICSELFAIHKLSQPIMQSKMKCLYLHQCLSEIRSHRLYELVVTSFEKGVLDLSNYPLMSKDIDTLKSILDRSSITHFDELNLSNSSIDDARCHQLCKFFNDNGDGMTFDRINLSGNHLSSNSLITIADTLVYCKTQVLCLPDNFNIKFDTTLMHLVMEYVFRRRALKYYLTIHCCNQEGIIFNGLDVKTIITHLYSRKMITGIYFFHCKFDDEIAIALSVIITKQKLPCEICLWNSHVPSNVIQHVLSLMLQKSENQLLFVYETSALADSDVTEYHFDKATSSTLTFIYLSEFRLVLHGVHNVHNKFISFINNNFNLINDTFTEIQLSNTKITEDIIISFSQMFGKCRMLSRCALLNNILDLHLLQQLINSVKHLSCLSQIMIEDDNMTFSDCCAIADELGSNHLHSVMIFCDNTLMVYRSHEKQLSNSDAVISTIMKLHKTNSIAVCEKLLITESNSFTYNACRSMQISHIFLCKTVLFAKRIKNFHPFLMMLNSSFPVSSITEVILSKCELNAKMTQFLIQALSQCKALRKITCDNNHFKSPQLSLQFFINRLIELPSLQQFIAYEENLALIEINEIIENLTVQNKELCVVMVTKDMLIGYKLSSISFSEALNLNITITDVWLLFCNIDKSVLETVGKVAHIKRITVLHGVMESQLFFDSTCNELEELCIFNNLLQLEVIYIAKALQRISSLTVLKLENNGIPQEAVNILAAAIRVNSSLEKLSLSGNRLGSSTVVIVNALKDISTLKELNLNDNKNRSESLGSAVASVLIKNKLMERLSLKDNGLNDSGVILIAQSLCELSSLKACNLRDNYITDKAAKALASVISNNTKLEELYLGNNQLQSGIIKIAITLQKVSTLKVLDLDNNNITEPAAKELSKAIEKNPSLENLWLNGIN